MIPSNSEPSVVLQGSGGSAGRSRESSPQLRWRDSSAAEHRPAGLAKPFVYKMPNTSTSYLEDKAHVRDCTNKKTQSHEVALITYMCVFLVKKAQRKGKIK